MYNELATTIVVATRTTKNEELMNIFINRSPPTDGGYAVDSDLHQMTDDGCPHGPNPTRWNDPEWRDNFGEWDTFDEELDRIQAPALVSVA